MLDKINKYRSSDIYLGVYYVNHMGFYIVCYLFLLIGLYLFSSDSSLFDIIWNYYSLWFIAIFGVFVLHNLTMYILVKYVNYSNISVNKEKRVNLKDPLSFIGTIIILSIFFFIIIYGGLYIYVLTPELISELGITREKIIASLIQNSLYMMFFLIILLRKTFTLAKKSIKEGTNYLKDLNINNK